MDNGWFWIFAAMFFIWGPFRWARRRHMGWGRWDPMGQDHAEKGTRTGERRTREEAEREAKRDEQVEQLEARVNELESRLDFAERLLASRRDQALIPPNS